MAVKLKMQSSDVVRENIDFISTRWPNVVKEVRNEEGNLVKMIDFDALKQELSREVISDKQERYQMTWPDKKKAVLLANSSINATLRPLPEKSVDFNSTKNLYIEGDNLDVLKLLRETYLGKIKMIYIDPPYNTGNDFVYADDFEESSEDYFERSGQFDDQGNRLFSNSEKNGRFHTDWLNMIYPRLKIAKDLLKDNGVIFISIGKEEVVNLVKICDEIYGNNNFISVMPRKTSELVRINSDSELQNINDYIVVYAKNKSQVIFNKKVTGTIDYKFSDENGKYILKAFQNSGENGTRTARPNLYYPIYFSPSNNSLSLRRNGDNDIEILPKQVMNDDGRWLWSKEKFEKEKKLLEYQKGTLYRKSYFNPDEDQNKYQPYKTWLDQFQNRNGAKALSDLELKGLFDYSKPVALITYLIELITNKGSNDIVLDFFSGSGTTAQSIFEKNIKDQGNRTFIMVQLPELTDNKKFPTICEIGEERIRRAGEKIKNENPLISTNLDTGFRVLKLDSSNMKDVYYNPKEQVQSLLFEDIDNVKEDRTPLDLLFQVMLDLGIELSAKITEKEIDGKLVYIINDSYLVASFAKDITEEVVRECAKINPVYVVFRDNSFSNDSANINCEQIIKTISPSTELKVL